MNKNVIEQSAPWWKFGHAWMVFALPAIVVVASFITLYLAVTRPDELVTEDYYRKGVEINKTLENTAENSASHAPALQARNHAQTGVVLKPQTAQKP
ncbi:MAG: FixH family protein [Rhodoferax sp.]|uniref:FixH family protein n=1 Tax=Rhodoferax sp. TaxID=50421 RepID=UPI0030171BF7